MAVRAAENRDGKISSSCINYGKLPRVYFIPHTLRKMSCSLVNTTVSQAASRICFAIIRSLIFSFLSDAFPAICYLLN